MVAMYKSPEGGQAMLAWYDSALQRLAVPYEARLLETRCGKTHTLVMGRQDAPPLVMIHGLGGCAPMWRPQFAALSQHFRLYALDTIGQPGKSASVNPPFAGDAYSEWLTDILDALEIEQTAILGLSLGGWLALKLCLYAPQRVSKALLISAPGFARLRPHFFLKSAPGVLNIRRMGDTAIRSLTYDFLAPSGSGITLHPEVEEAMYLVLRHYNLGGYSAQHWPAISEIPALLRDIWLFIHPLSSEQLARVTVPVYMMVGQYESLFNPEAALQYARHHLTTLRAADLIPAAGHGLNYDQPELVNTRLLQFLCE